MKKKIKKILITGTRTIAGFKKKDLCEWLILQDLKNVTVQLTDIIRNYYHRLQKNEKLQKNVTTQTPDIVRFKGCFGYKSKKLHFYTLYSCRTQKM